MSNPRDNIEAKLGLTGPPLSPVRDAPPQVPDHELVRRIGQGAYGEVWLARNALGTWRAVKIVNRDNFKDARPYEREFAGIRRFEPLSRSNEGFVDILQVGRDDAGGWFYYVMELADAAKPRVESSDSRVEGEAPSADQLSTLNFHPSTYSPRTLSYDLHHRGRLRLEDCLELGLTLTLALGHLHRHGLIHRDVKPSNIIFVGGVPKLADIGLVTEAAGANTFVGTEGFVPPEGPTSPQADIYALGKVLYEAAMGKDRNEFPEPFTQISTDRESVALMELNTILLRACAPNPKTRYASAEEMHADLALLHSGGSVKRRHQVERHFRIAKRVGAAAITATLLIGAAWFWQEQQTGKMTRLAVEKSALATEKSRLADNLTKLGEENRQRIVRLDIANGVRLLDDNDPSAALLWFADALPLVTNNPAVAEIHRIRIQQTLDSIPRLLNVVAEGEGIADGAFSPDGRRFATITVHNAGSLGVREAEFGKELWRLAHDECALHDVRFSRDGTKLLVSSTPPRQRWIYTPEPYLKTAEVVDAASGRILFQRTHSDLTSTAFSPNDVWLAIAHTNLTIELVDIRDGHTVAELRGHTNEITSLDFSGDSDILASTGCDHSVRFWQVPSGDSVGEPIVLDHCVSRIALSKDGRYLASSWDRDNQPSNFQVLDIDSRQKLAPGDVENSRGASLFFFSPGSKARLVTGDGLGRVRVWNLGTNLTQEAELDLGDGSALCWAFSPDASRLALGTEAGFVSVWSTETWQPLFPFLRHNGWVMSVDFSPDGSQLLTTGDDGTTKCWSLRHEKEAAQFTLSTNLPSWIATPFGRTPGLLPLDLTDGWLHLVDPDRLEDVQTLKTRPPGAAMTRWVPGSTSRYWVLSERGATNGSPDHLTLWTRQDGVFRFSVLTLPDVGGALPDAGGACQFSGDDSRLFTFGRDAIVRVWRTSDGTLERSIPVPQSFRVVPWRILYEPFSPDGRTFLVASGGTPNPLLLQLFDLATGQIAGKPVRERFLGSVTKMLFSPDHTQFAFVSSYQTASILNFSTGSKVTTPKHGGMLQELDWSPDGKKLVTAGDAPDLKIWDAGTGAMLLSPMEIDKSSLGRVCWSADGRFIASRSDDKKVRVWDASTTEAVTPLLSHQGSVVKFGLTPNQRLITASLPNLLRAWDLKPTSLPVDVIADYAKLLSGRRLNAGGVLLPIAAKELAELAQSLRARAPQLFE